MARQEQPGKDIRKSFSDMAAMIRRATPDDGTSHAIAAIHIASMLERVSRQPMMNDEDLADFYSVLYRTITDSYKFESSTLGKRLLAFVADSPKPPRSG